MILWVSYRFDCGYCARAGLDIDLDSFNELMQQQRQQSQAASQFNADYHAAASLDQQSVFHGYDVHVMDGKILALLQDGKGVVQLDKGQKGGVVLDNTPFYAESGGQVGIEVY